MVGEIKKLIFTSTAKDISVVFVGTIVNAILGGIFFIFAPRILGPSQYGLFAVVVSTGIMVTGFANFGIDTGILRFTSSGNIPKNRRILKLALSLYLTIGIAVFILGLTLAPIFSELLGNSSLTTLLRIAFSGVIFLLLTDFFVAALQSIGKFVEASFINILSNAARLLVLAFAALFMTVNVYFLTALFFFITIVSVAAGKLFVPIDFIKEKNSRSELKNFLTFNTWIAASLAISSIPFDNYLLVKYSGPIATGIYAAPFKILSIVDQFAGNFSRVMASRLSSFDQNKKTILFVKKTLPFVGVVTVGFLLSIFIAPTIISILLGSQYAMSVNIFRILAISSIFTFATSIPVSILIYYYGKSKETFLITALVISIWIVSLVLLVPSYHETGAAYAFLINEIAAFTIYSVYTFILLKK